MPYDINVNFSETNTKSLVDNMTFASPTGFRLMIDRLKYPNAEFNVQSASIPEVAVDSATLNTPQRTIEVPGDKVRYADLEITFLIDEGMINYQEIHDWIVGMATEPETPNINKTRDMSLLVLNSHNNVAKEIRFTSAYPVALSTLEFNATNTNIEYLVGSITFNYAYFEVR